jgi:hypothetical protein
MSNITDFAISRAQAAVRPQEFFETQYNAIRDLMPTVEPTSRGRSLKRAINTGTTADASSSKRIKALPPIGDEMAPSDLVKDLPVAPIQEPVVMNAAAAERGLGRPPKDPFAQLPGPSKPYPEIENQARTQGTSRRYRASGHSVPDTVYFGSGSEAGETRTSGTSDTDAATLPPIPAFIHAVHPNTRPSDIDSKRTPNLNPGSVEKPPPGFVEVPGHIWPWGYCHDKDGKWVPRGNKGRQGWETVRKG